MPKLIPATLDRLHSAASAHEWTAAEAIRRAAEDAGVSAYVVGGAVRDLLLGRPVVDIDIAIEGDAQAIARHVAASLGLEPPRVHPDFGTATLLLPSAATIDVITARRERYPHPGALPVVTPSSIADDLARRDFTINAMALGLAGADRGRLLDPHGGATDLDRRLLRVLHEHSFKDDATRLLRGTRYAARFGFAFDSLTEAAARTDRSFLTAISPARVRHEFGRIFAEADPGRALILAQQLGVSGVLLPLLRFTSSIVAAYRRLTREAPGDTCVAWLLAATRLQPDAIDAYIERFALLHNEARAARALPEVRAALRRLARADTRPSAVVAALERLPVEAIQAFALGDPRTSGASIARRYLREFRSVRPALDADDLKRLRVPPGPLFGDVLRALRAARLDDPNLTLDAESALVQHMLEAHRGA